MNPSENIPNEIWTHIMSYMRFQEILMLQIITKKLQGFALKWVTNTEKILKDYPHESISLPRYKTVGTSLPKLNLLWAAKDKTFNKPVNDSQTRAANRGLGFIDDKWVWIRGPFESGHHKEIFICIFQEDHIYNLVKHLKKYEVELLSRFVDNIIKGDSNILVPKKNETCIIS